MGVDVVPLVDTSVTTMFSGAHPRAVTLSVVVGNPCVVDPCVTTILSGGHINFVTCSVVTSVVVDGICVITILSG